MVDANGSELQVNQLPMKTRVLLHILVWLSIFFIPYMIIEREAGFSIHHAMEMIGGPLALAIVFYSNYLHLVRQYFFKKKRNVFAAFNILVFIVALFVLHLCMEVANAFSTETTNMTQDALRQASHGIGTGFWGCVLMELRNIVIFVLVMSLSIIVLRNKRLKIEEAARRQAELGRTQAELQNLRHQISPHFLLNTLNNIYALITFDKEKAQYAVQDLSKMLSMMLNLKNDTEIPLTREIDFLKHYIELMKLRQSDNVDIKFEVNIPTDTQLMISPLILISLVENAFKHGVSPIEPSFIHISIKASKESKNILFHIENSNYPKNQKDKSGHGIGLQQVAKRLELSYKNCYTWDKGLKDQGKTYYSKLEIITNIDRT